MKFLGKEVNPIGLLGYSLGCLYLANDTSDSTIRILLWIIALISFVLFVITFIKVNFSLPLVPCKDRVSKDGWIICPRDIGYCLGFFFSILSIIIIKKHQLDFPLKNHSLLIGIICTTLTMLHGILRRYFRILNSHNFFYNLLTIIVGFITGIGTLFIAIYFIYFL